MINSFIINLERNPERFESISNQLQKHAIKYERFSAVDGSKISDADLLEFANARPRAKLAGKWTKGKMGCDLSHYELWKKAAKSDDPYTLILEDDVHIAEDIKQFTGNLDWIPSDADIIRLEGTTLMKCKIRKHPSKRVGKRYLHELLPNKFKNAFAVGAGAYIIKKEAAQRLIDSPLDALTYVDRALFDHTTSGVAHKLKTYQVTPAPVMQDKFLHSGEDITFHSEIETKEEGEIYLNPNPIKRYLRKYGSKVGLFQIISAIRQLLYILNGYKYIYFKKESDLA